MSNFLTTLFGAISALGAFFSHNSNATLQTIGTIATVVGPLGLGVVAKDASNSK